MDSKESKGKHCNITTYPEVEIIDGDATKPKTRKQQKRFNYRRKKKHIKQLRRKEARAVQGLEKVVKVHTVGSLDSFSVVINDVCLDSLIPPLIKTEYHTLCSSRMVLLHSTVHHGYSPSEAAEAVISAVELAKNIHGATPFVKVLEFDSWIAESRRLEEFGLDVAFLRERAEQLKSIVCGDGSNIERLDGWSLFEQHKEGLQCFRATTRELRAIEEQIGRLENKQEELAGLKRSQTVLLDELDAKVGAFVSMATTPW